MMCVRYVMGVREGEGESVSMREGERCDVCVCEGGGGVGV